MCGEKDKSLKRKVGSAFSTEQIVNGPIELQLPDLVVQDRERTNLWEIFESVVVGGYAKTS
jgi:hypothetical protein